MMGKGTVPDIARKQGKENAKAHLAFSCALFYSAWASIHRMMQFTFRVGCPAFS